MPATPPDASAQLHAILKDFNDAMLVTHLPSGRMRSRPLAVAGVRADGGLYFGTAIDSPKVHELRRHPKVNVSLQSPGRFVSISGSASVSRDPKLIDELWSEAWRVWFPRGREDPELCVLIVEPDEAEYWDRSGLKGFRYLFEATRAVFTRKQPELDDRQHGKITR